MKELTKAEEQVMQYIWELKSAFLKDIVDRFPEPKPAYTTIQTVIRILVKKKFIGYHTFGKANQYYPLVKKEFYSKWNFKTFLKEYFNNSISDFASFFTNDKDLDIKDLEEIQHIVHKKINQKKKE